MNELKPEDVVRALEHCANYKNASVSCIGCPIYGRCFDEPNLLEKSALALLREKDAEIERLTTELQAMRGAANSLKMHYNSAKSEAITDFAERLKGFIVQNICVVDDSTDAIYKEINQIEKEMKEGGRWQN